MLAALAASGCGDDAPSVAAVGPDIRAEGTLLVSVTWPQTIAVPAPGETLTLSCVIEHLDGTREEVPSAKVRSVHGSMAGTCAAVLPGRSAVDTLEISAQGLRARLPVAVALPPEVQGGPVGTLLAHDSVPGGVPWAPYLWRGPDGVLELYLASIAVNKESLVRLRLGSDNVFHYDETVFTPPEDDCASFGTGFENVVVVPRAEGSGLRMLFAGGGPCHGWEVHSAVSPDGRKWTLEPGVRIANGELDWWSQGEGMVVDRLPDGEWRMLLGGIAPSDPVRAAIFEILEWRSRDQLSWRYAGTALTTAEMPDEADGSVYSPTIREFAPGLYRMIFTADNRNGPGPNRSALWTAVSTDRQRWQVERELLGAPGTDLYYATLVDDLLVTVRIDGGEYLDGGTHRFLARATVRMP